MAGQNTGGQRFAGDDGKADPRVAAILAGYAVGREPEQTALIALAGTRLLIPLVERDAGPEPTTRRAACPADPRPGDDRPADAVLADACHADSHPAGTCGSSGSSPGREMAFPTLIGRDGRPALLAFTSLDALTRWRADARPVPALATQVWETAVADSCAVVIDVAGPVPIAVDGARLGALARGEPPPAPQDDPDVHAQVAEALAGQPAIAGAELAAGGEGTDLAIRLMVRPGTAPFPHVRRADVQRAAETIAARLAGRLRRGIEVWAPPCGARSPRPPVTPRAAALVCAAAGLLVGGYVTVLIERVPASRTISGSFGELARHPLGECPRCAAGLRAADIVPLLGWARTGGLCRDCGEPFGAWHPAAELLTATVFALMGLRFGLSPVLPAYLYLAAVAVALAFIDVAHRRLPDLLTLGSYPVAFAALGAATPVARDGTSHLIHAFIGLACASACYLILALIYPAGIGWGDVKLSGLLGLYLGWISPTALFIGLAAGFVLAALVGAGLIVAGKATRRSQLAFGPFMLAGAVAIITGSGLR